MGREDVTICLLDPGSPFEDPTLSEVERGLGVFEECGLLFPRVLLVQ